MKAGLYLVCHDSVNLVKDFLQNFFPEEETDFNHEGWITFQVPESDFKINLMNGSSQELQKTQGVALEIYYDSLSELQEFANKHTVEIRSFNSSKASIQYTYHYCTIPGPDNICFIEVSYSEVSN